MATENIFTHWMFTDYALPWLLVFVLIFAILEKSKLLGDGKKQINAIIGAVCGLLLLAFPASRGLVVSIIPVLVVLAVLIFVFMLLYGFVSGETRGDIFKNKGVKTAFGVAIGIILIIAVLVITGQWDKAWDFVISSTGANILFILIAVAAVVAVLHGGGKDKSED